MNRRLVTVLLAVVLGLAGTLAVLWYGRSADERAAAGKDPVTVLVAAKAVPAGTPVSALLHDGYVKEAVFPAASVPSDALHSLDGRPADNVVRDSLAPGELLRSSLIVPKGSSTAFVIPDGDVALTVQLTDPQRVAGYLRAGSKVAVFATAQKTDAKGAAKSQLTRLIAKDLQVLALGPGQGGTTGSTPAGSLVTLAVSQNDAERLVLGSCGTAAGSLCGTSSALYLALEGDGSALDLSAAGASTISLFG